MATFIDGVGAEDVVAEPFPYLVLRDALPEDRCARLISEFPALDVVSQGRPMGSNLRYSMSAPEALGAPEMPPVWRELIEQHISQEFLDGLMRIFGDHIRRLYPSFEQDHAPLDELRVGVRRVESDSDVHLDAQISINTPVLDQPNSVRECHLDAPNKLFVGLFYLRTDDDDSVGGDLEISRWRRDAPRGLRGRMAYRAFTQVVETVPYARNTLILFVNSPYSLHGVTVRSRTKAPRLFLNLLGEVKSPLFTIDGYQASKLDKAIASPEIIKRKLAAAR